MSNERNKVLYKKVIRTFNESFRGGHTDLENMILKAHDLFRAGFVPTEYPSSDFGKQVLGDLAEYSHLVSLRRKIDIAGAERDFATEIEAYKSLVLASKLVDELILPHFHSKTKFSNKVFNDIYNLGLAYLHSIVASVAQEYIDEEEAVDAKNNAVKIASKGIKLHDAYHQEVESHKQLKSCVKKFVRNLGKAQPELLRSFELVPISQKKIYKGEEIMEEMVENISQTDDSEKFLFKPAVIFPIAQGGNEFGLRIAHAYQDKGYSPPVYPLLYSIKTRRHRSPWIDNDSRFLRRNFEDQDLLVVEDWVTTGNTLRGVLNEIDRKYPHEIRVATIKRDPSRSKIPPLRNYHFYVGKWTRYTGSKVDSLRNTQRRKRKSL